MQGKNLDVEKILQSFPEESSYDEIMEALEDFPEEEKKRAIKEMRRKQHGFWDHPKQIHYYSEVHHRVPLIREHFKDLAKMVDPQPGEAVLDLGCGVGTFLKFLLTENKSKDYKVIGIDYSDRAIKKAKERLAGLTEGIDINFFVGDLKDPLSFQDNSIDKAVSNWAIVYLPKKDLKHSLREVKRILKKGGRFFFTALIRGGAMKHMELKNLGFLLSSIIQEPGATFKGLRFEKECRSYFPEYSLDELKGMMKEAGFKILDTQYTVIGKTATIIQEA